MAKKVAEYTITRIEEDEDGNKVEKEMASKPIWGGMFRIDDNEDQKTWGWIYFYMHPTYWRDLYQVRNDFNSEKEVNLKVKDDEDYYGNERKKLYIPRPEDKMQKVLDQLQFTYEQEYSPVYKLNIERKEDVEWKDVRKNEIAKVL